MDNIVPTKTNLINSKKSLDFSLKGYELLDKKRNVLIKEVMSYLDRVKELQNKINNTFEAAYDALRKANITIGISNVEDISLSIPEATQNEVVFKSVMGVEIPEIKYEFKKIEPHYSMIKSNSAIDIAYEKFNEVKYLVFELAEIENAIYKLTEEIKSTRKRANALENIQIPKYRARVKIISEVLEEKEREDFFRMKILKKRNY